MTEHYSDEFEIPVLSPGVSPLHGYRGVEEEEPAFGIPLGLTIAISREAGARGATIARRAGELRFRGPEAQRFRQDHARPP